MNEWLIWAKWKAWSQSQNIFRPQHSSETSPDIQSTVVTPFWAPWHWHFIHQIKSYTNWLLYFPTTLLALGTYVYIHTLLQGLRRRNILTSEPWQDWQDFSFTQLPLTGYFLFLVPFSVNPRDVCASVPVDQQLVKYSILAPTTMPLPSSLKSSFFPFLTIAVNFFLYWGKF